MSWWVFILIRVDFSCWGPSDLCLWNVERKKTNTSSIDQTKTNFVKKTCVLSSSWPKTQLIWIYINFYYYLLLGSLVSFPSGLFEFFCLISDDRLLLAASVTCICLLRIVFLLKCNDNALNSNIESSCEGAASLNQ